MKFILASYSRHGFLSRLGIVDLTSRPPRVESCSRRTEVSRWSLWAAVELMSTSGRRSSRSSLESSSVCCGWKSTESSLLSGWLSRALDRNHPFRIDVRDSWPAPSRRRPSRSITSNRGAVNRQLLSTGGQCPLWNVPVCVCVSRPTEFTSPFFPLLVIFFPPDTLVAIVALSGRNNTVNIRSSQQPENDSTKYETHLKKNTETVSNFKKDAGGKKRGGGGREKKEIDTHTHSRMKQVLVARDPDAISFHSLMRQLEKHKKNGKLSYCFSSCCLPPVIMLDHDQLLFFFVGLLELFWWFFSYF